MKQWTMLGIYFRILRYLQFYSVYIYEAIKYSHLNEILIGNAVHIHIASYPRISGTRLKPNEDLSLTPIMFTRNMYQAQAHYAK